MKIFFHKYTFVIMVGVLVGLVFLPLSTHAQYFGGGGPNNWFGTQVSGGLNGGGLIHGNGLQGNTQGGTTLGNGQGSPINGNSQGGTMLGNSQGGIILGTPQNTPVYGNSQGGVLYNVNTQPGGACSNSLHTFGDVLYFLACIMNQYLIGISISLATIYTIWSVISYVVEPDSVEERKKSREAIIWGVITMFVIISVWGIVAFFRKTLGL